jgi:hypothetical protein
MRKGPGSVYDKWNISVVICDTYSITVNQVMVATVKNFEVMTSTLPKRTLGSVVSLLTATLYQGNHKLWNIVSTERYILHNK